MNQSFLWLFIERRNDILGERSAERDRLGLVEELLEVDTLFIHYLIIAHILTLEYKLSILLLNGHYRRLSFILCVSSTVWRLLL